MSARTQVLLAALLFSTAGIAVKAASLTAWQIASLRSVFAAVVVLVAFRQVRRPTLPLAGVSALIAVTFITFIVATRLTTAAHAVFLQAAAPVYLVVLGPWLLGESLSRRDVPFLVTVLVGVGLLALSETPAQATAARPVLGNAIAIFSGVTWALSLAGLRWLDQRETGGSMAVSATVYANVLVAVGGLAVAWPLTDIGLRDWAVVAYLGTFQLGLAYVLLVRGLETLPALETSLLLLLEPALNPLWTWIGHGESPGRLGVLGGALVLTATTWRSLRGAGAAPSVTARRVAPPPS